MNLFDFPLFTVEIMKDEFQLPPESTFVFGVSDGEIRSNPSEKWLSTIGAAGQSFFEIRNQGLDEVKVHGGDDFLLALYDQDTVASWLKDLQTPVYLDITALAHRTWAPIVKAAIENKVDLRVTYLEPSHYKRSEIEVTGLIYDLSERIGGIEPLPGFVRIRTHQKDGLFVPMLGFEGARLEHIVANIEVEPENIFPIVGVPGFRPEYSFDAYRGNRLSLEAEQTYQRVSFAKANCPFDAFHSLAALHEHSGLSEMRIAPIGTKPHALGAVLFAIARGAAIELIYDHPVRSRSRTEGEARMCVYDITSFSRSRLFTDESIASLSSVKV